MVFQSPDPERTISSNSSMPEQPAEREQTPVDLVQRELSDIREILNAITGSTMEPDLVLAMIADKTRWMTGASGAAIALADGSGIVWKAASGAVAPPVGTALNISSGFSGECVSTGQVVRCDDADNDSRVVADGCRKMGTRSMIAVPLVVAGKVLGVLEVFSSQGHAFGDEDVAALQRMGTLVLGVVAESSPPSAGTKEPAANSESAETEDEFPPYEELEKKHLPWRRLVPGAVIIASLVLLVIVWYTRRKPFGGVSAASTVLSSAQDRQHASSLPAPDLVALSTDPGDPNAQFVLGSRYLRGEGVKQDYQEAAKLFALAAQQGHVPSESMLATLYFMGRGVPKDYVTAYMWSSIALQGGDPVSKERLGQLKTYMSLDDLTQAQRRTEEWLKKHPPANPKTAESSRKQQ